MNNTTTLPSIADLITLPHLLVAGRHAEAVDNIRHQLHRTLQENAPEVELIDLSEHPVEERLRLLQEQARAAIERLRWFDMAGVSGLNAFNTRRPETLRFPGAERFLPKQPLHRRVILLHNPAELLRHAPSEAGDALLRLAKATSRSHIAPRDVGFHLILSSYTPTRQALPPRLLRHIPARFFMRGNKHFFLKTLTNNV